MASILLAAAELDSQNTGTPVSDETRQNLRLLAAGVFRLVVMGEIKKGKSSFINAMLNQKELVPTSSNVATSTIFKIRYGKEISYTVFFTAESGKKELRIGVDDLPKFGTEDGNPGNEKQVDFIEVTCPSPVLQTGIVMIDTPGLGGLFREHKKITYQYVPKADAVFFVTDSVESPIGELETEYLRDIAGITKHVYFVQTKCCSVDEAAANTRKRSNLSILSSSLGMEAGKVRYFMVDSEIRHAAEEAKSQEYLMLSGYPELLSFIHRELQPSQRRILAEKAVLAFTPVLQRLAARIADSEKLIEADTTEKRSKLEQDIRAGQQAVSEWEMREKGKLLRSLNAALDANSREVVDTLGACRPNGEVQSRLEEMITRASDKRELREVLEKIGTLLPEYASKCMQGAAQTLQEKTEQVLMEHLQVSIGQSSALDKVRDAGGGLSPNTSRFSMLLDDMQASGGAFNTIRTASFGGSTGQSVGAIVGLAIGSVIPGVGHIAGAFLGGIAGTAWGAVQAHKQQANAELKSYRNQAIAALSSAVADMYSQMMSSFNQMNAEIKARVQDAIAEAVICKTEELRKNLEELQARSKMDAEAIKARKQELEDFRQKVLLIRRGIAEYLPAAQNTPHPHPAQ